MKLFELRRIEDESGISGTGTVAQGVVFDNGWCALTWLTKHTSVAFYTSVDEVVAIHGHGGKTEVVQIADCDGEKVSQLTGNYIQDECEGVNEGILPSKENYHYMVKQRRALARLFAPRKLEEDGDGEEEQG
jgi:hypothetical protein